MSAIDTGPIVAMFDRSDDKHALCMEAFKGIRQPLLTTWPVLTEVFYLLGFSHTVQDDLWEFIQRGVVAIYDMDGPAQKRCRELMKKYHDLPMDLADASLVAAADAANTRTIFTLDRDFKIYRTSQNRRFKLLPA
jgi:predicted nucleic acid-binding protein